MTAGLATLKTLEDGQLINKLNRLGDRIREQLREIFKANGVDVQVTGVGSLFHTHFTKEEVRNAHVGAEADKKKLIGYHLYLIARGVFLLPTHEGVLSTAHSKVDIEKLFLRTEEYARQCYTA